MSKTQEIKTKRYWQIAIVSVSILIILLGLELCSTSPEKNCSIDSLDFEFLVFKPDLSMDEATILSSCRDTIRPENRLLISLDPSFRNNEIDTINDKASFCAYLETDEIPISGICFALICNGDTQNITSSISSLRREEMGSLSTYSIDNEIHYLNHSSLEGYIDLYNTYVTGGGDSYIDLFDHAIYNFTLPSKINKNQYYEFILWIEFVGRDVIMKKKRYYFSGVSPPGTAGFRRMPAAQ